MNNSEEQIPFLLCMHIPKTGGTTFRSILDCQLGKNKVLLDYDLAPLELEYLSAHINNPIASPKTIIGHFRYGIHKYTGDNSKYISWLRHPVERGISQYFHERKAFLKKQVNAPSHIAATFAEDLELRADAYSNTQLKFLTGMEDIEHPSADHLLHAYENIEKNFIALGITEYFTEFVLLLSKQLGWKPVRFANLNTGDIGNVSAGVIKKLETINNLDLQLYDFANRRFQALINEQGEDFHRAKLELEKNVNKMETYRTTNYLDAEFTHQDMPAVSTYLGSGS